MLPMIENKNYSNMYVHITHPCLSYQYLWIYYTRMEQIQPLVYWGTSMSIPFYKQLVSTCVRYLFTSVGWIETYYCHLITFQPHPALDGYKYCEWVLIGYQFWNQTATHNMSTTLAALVPSPHLISDQNMSMMSVETHKDIRGVLDLVGVITCAIVWLGLMGVVRYCFSKFF